MNSGPANDKQRQFGRRLRITLWISCRIEKERSHISNLEGKKSHPMVGKTAGDDTAVDEDVAAFRGRVAGIVEKFPARIVRRVAAGSVTQFAGSVGQIAVSVVQIARRVGQAAGSSVQITGCVPKVDDE